MKQKELTLKVYAQYNIFGTIDYMNGDTIVIANSKENKPFKVLKLAL